MWVVGASPRPLRPGQIFKPRGRDLLVKDEARKQRRAHVRGEVVERAVEDHLREHELVTRRDLARRAPLQLHRVIRGHVAEPPQHALHPLELRAEGQPRRGLGALAQHRDLRADHRLALKLGEQRLAPRCVLVQRVRVHLALERLGFAGEFVVGLRARGVAQRLSEAPRGFQRG